MRNLISKLLIVGVFAFATFSLIAGDEKKKKKAAWEELTVVGTLSKKKIKEKDVYVVTDENGKDARLPKKAPKKISYDDFVDAKVTVKGTGRPAKGKKRGARFKKVESIEKVESIDKVQW